MVGQLSTWSGTPSPSPSRSPVQLLSAQRVVVTGLLSTGLSETPILKLAVAWLMYAPSAVTRTVTVTSPDAPGLRLPRSQVTVPAWPASLPLLLALANVVPAGSGSLIVMLFATPLPVLA